VIFLCIEALESKAAFMLREVRKMKRCDRILLACLLGFLLSTSGAFAQPDREYKEGELLIKFTPGISSQAATISHASLGSRVAKRFRKTGIQLVKLRASLTTQEGIELYKQNPDVEYAEPNYKLYALDVFPNDPMFDDLWGLHNTGQTGGTTDADIDAPEAWEITTGSNEVIVAVIDTGVDYDHDDLAANMWVNDAELNGTADVDDDGNGYIDDIYGIDAYNKDADPMDDHSHGTHCSGTIAAIGNNGIGVVGVNWNAKIMALKFLGANGSGYTDGAIECLEYVIMMKQNGHDVGITSNSWGGGGYSQSLYDTIQDAGEANILFVAAAGNNSVDTDTHLNYPSCYDLPNIIAVAATDDNDQLASFSNWGQTTVDVAAPGVDIYSTFLPFGYLSSSCHDDDGDGYGFCSGTSMAAPHVSGLAGLILARAPFYTWDEAKSIILATVDPLSSLEGLILTGGRINAEQALLSVCSSAGDIRLDREGYRPGVNINVTVLDTDLNTNPMAIEQYSGLIAITTTGGDEETSITLTESSADHCSFVGTIAVEDAEANPGDGVLQIDCEATDTITATYYDADDGTGNPATPSDTAYTDCTAPAITNVEVAGVAYDGTTITWDTDEPADSCIYYGTALPTNLSKCQSSMVTAHTITLTGLNPDTTYYFAVASTDDAGNQATDDNGGTYYQFHSFVPTTHYVPDDYPSIQEAINGTPDGDIVILRAGTYYENISFLGKAITIQGESGAQATVIDGSGAGTTVTFNSSAGPDSVMDGVTIANGTSANGGGIYCNAASSPTIVNCIIVNNTATELGGAIYCDRSSSPTIANCVITGNTAGWQGGGIYCYNASATVVNSILWGDKAGGTPNEIYLQWQSSIDVTYSDVEGGYLGQGNIDCDPEFAGSGDYHLLASSCCVDAGTSDGAPSEDMEGDPRPQGGGFDIGADEYIEHKGLLALDKEIYPLGVITFTVMDSDLNTNPIEAEVYSGIIDVSTSAGDEETNVTLSETGADTGVFTGTIGMADTTVIQGDGVLEIDCSIEDTITATYYDTDDGTGNPATPSDTASTDCFSPVITNVEIEDVGFNAATVTWNTDEPSDSCVHYGTSVPPDSGKCQSSMVSAHTIKLTGLVPDTTYYFAVASTDAAGNETLDDSNGQYYQFQTSVMPTEWVMTYGGFTYDQAPALELTSDGGYIVAGETRSFGAGNYDYWALKLDSYGNVDWEKTYGGMYGDNADSVQQTFNEFEERDGYVVAGSTLDSNDIDAESDLWILRLDLDGQIIWQKTYDRSASDWSADIQQTTDGGFAVVAKTDNVIWMLKLDSDGTVDWEKTYGGSAYCYYGTSFQQTTDGGYVMAGYITPEIYQDCDTFVLKLDSSGNIEWQKKYGLSHSNSPRSIQQTADGGFIVGGDDGQGDAWIFKLDSYGNVEWEKKYDGCYLGSCLEDVSEIQQTTDGGYIVAGETSSFGAGGSDVWVLKLNSAGGIIWQKTLGGSEWDRTSSVRETTDGGYIVAGTTPSFGAGSTDMWLMKLDANGEIPSCGLVGQSSSAATNTSATVGDPGVISQTSSAVTHATGVTPQDTEAEISVLCPGAAPPMADFTADTTSGAAPLTVQFTDQSTGSIDTWSWDFDNDGTVDSHDQNPSWTYTEADDYTVSLTVTGPGGSDTETKTDYIHVTEPSGPIIDKIRGVKEPGKIIRIIGSGFEELQGDSEVHIGPKVYGPGHQKIKLWTDTKIKVRLPNYKCEWFQGNDYRRRKIWVMVGGQDGVSSNVKKIKVFKPDTCP